MTGRVRASLERVMHNAGPIAVLGVFLLLAVVVYAVLRINAQTKTIKAQQQTVVALQQAQAESSKTGRTTQLQVAGLVQQIANFTDPNSQTSKDQQSRTANILAELDAAQRAGRADQLAKIAQMFEQCRSLPCATSTITRILAEPVPVPTFAGMAAVTPAPAPAASSSPTRSTSPAKPVASPAPSMSPTPCKGPVVVQATPLLLGPLQSQVQVCIPP